MEVPKYAHVGVTVWHIYVTLSEKVDFRPLKAPVNNEVIRGFLVETAGIE